jgi:hypothetical protein
LYVRAHTEGKHGKQNIITNVNIVGYLKERIQYSISAGVTSKQWVY